MKEAEAIATTLIDHLKKNNQYDLLSDIVDILHKEIFRSQDITVVSALPLSKEEESALKKNVTAKWGEHDVTISVDPTILSGIIVRFQDQIIDMSGKNKLGQLEENLVKSN